jgi:hypothetical protein
LLDEAVAPKTQEEEVTETPKIEPKPKEVDEKEKTPEVKEEPAPIEPKKDEQAAPMNMGMPAMMPPMPGMK